MAIQDAVGDVGDVTNAADDVADHLYAYATESSPGSVASDFTRERIARKADRTVIDPWSSTVQRRQRLEPDTTTDPYMNAVNRRRGLENAEPRGIQQPPSKPVDEQDFSSQGSVASQPDFSTAGTPVEEGKTAEPKPPAAPPPARTAGEAAAITAKAAGQAAVTGAVADPLKAAALTPEFEKAAYEQLKPDQIGAAANAQYPTLAAPYRKEVKARERQQAAAQARIAEQTAVPVEQRPLFQAGEKVKKWAEDKMPLTDEEKSSIWGKVGTFAGGIVPAAGLTLIGSAVGMPGVGMTLGATQLGLQGAGASFDKALQAGATPEEAAKAAGMDGLVSGALGAAPLGAILAPVRAAGRPIIDAAGNEVGRQIAPGILGWMAAKLEQALKSGITFAGVGEAQEWLSKQVAAEYNGSAREHLRIEQAKLQTQIEKVEAEPRLAKANEKWLEEAKTAVKGYDKKIANPSEYEIDPERIAISFFGGAALGTLHPHGLEKPQPAPGPVPPPGAASAAGGPGGAGPGPGLGGPRAAPGAGPSAGAGPGGAGPGAGPGGTAGPGAGPAGAGPGPGATGPQRPPPNDTARQAKMRTAFEKGLSDAGINEPNLPFDDLRDLYKTVDGLRTGFGRTDLVGKSPDDLKAMFEQLSVLKNYGFEDHDLKTMPAADIAREYAEAIKKGASANTKPPPEAEPKFEEASFQEPAAAQPEPKTAETAQPERQATGTREDPIELQSGADVERAAGVASQDHSHAQGEAHNAEQGYGSWNGLHIAFEAPAGGVRRGTNPRTGKPWEGRVGAATGYIVNGPLGADGDKLDVYFGPNPPHPEVYVLDELNKGGGKFRQTKSFIGFDSPKAAVDAYLSTENKSADQIGGVTPMESANFVDWVQHGDHTKAVRGPSSGAQARTQTSPGPAELPPPASETGGGTNLVSPQHEEKATGSPVQGEGKVGISAEVERDHHKAIEKAISDVGFAPHQVAPNDVALAAQFHAAGIEPAQAFQMAVLRNAIDNGYLSEKELIGIYGPEIQKVISGVPAVEHAVPSGRGETAAVEGAHAEPAAAGGAKEAGELSRAGETGEGARAEVQHAAPGGAAEGAKAGGTEVAGQGGEATTHAGVERPERAHGGTGETAISAPRRAGERPSKATGGTTETPGRSAGEPGAAERAKSEELPVKKPSVRHEGGAPTKEELYGEQGGEEKPIVQRYAEELADIYKAKGKDAANERMKEILGARKWKFFEVVVLKDKFRDLIKEKPTEASGFYDALRRTQYAGNSAAKGPDGNVYRIKKDGNSWIVMRMSSEKGVPNQYIRPEKGEGTWSLEEAIKKAVDLAQPNKVGPEHVSDDDINAAIEAEMRRMAEEEAKPKRERKPRQKQEGEKKTAKQAAAGAAKAGASFLDEATVGLSQLFGGGKTVGAGPAFDKDTYEKAKPFFYRAAAHFRDLLDNLAAFAGALTRHMRDAARLTLDQIKDMQVYLAQFVKDIRDGAIKIRRIIADLDQERANERVGTSGRVGEEGVGEPRERLADGKSAGGARAERVETQPAEDVGRAPEAERGETPGARSGEQVPGGAKGEPAGGPAADRREGAGGERLADDGRRGGRPDHASLRPNYHIADPERIVGGSPKVRFGKNQAAIEAFRALEGDENRDPTKEELDAMAGFTGWGTFGQELFQGTWDRPRPVRGWEAEDKWLREHLGVDEWKSAQESIINAHYTDPPTVQAMWDMARAMGFDGGRVLEPSMGIGNFFGLMPRDLMEKSDLTGIEMDKITGGMAKLLYPQANVQVKPYQDSMTPDNFYDLAIGNWPFSAVGPVDRRYGHLTPTLHDYFFVKALDQVRPGGIVMGITSAGTMDKVGKQIRIALGKNAELVGAFRLPSGAFQQYAGTKVVTDVIVLRKREKPVVNLDDTSWLESSTHPVPSGEIRSNEYWRAHPDRVLGTLDYGHGTTTGRPGMIVHRPENYGEQLENLKNQVPKDAYQPIQRGKEARFEPNNTLDRDGAVTVHSTSWLKDGLYLVSGERLFPLEEVAKYKTADKKRNEKRENQLRTMVGMRRTYGALIDAERNGAADTEVLRDQLRREYQTFVKAHGKLGDSDGLAIMRKLEDPYHPILASLERPDGSPSRILSESTTRAKKKLENPTVSDAFVAQRNASRNLDVDRIAALAKVPVEQVIKELSDSNAIYRTVGGGYEVADVFLSGNVRRKHRGLIEARDGGEQGLDKSIEAIAKVIPENIPYYKIEAKLGATWVPDENYAQFIAHMLGVEPGPQSIKVKFSAGRWKVTLGRGLNERPEATAQWGHPRYRFDKLLRAAMGNQSVKIFDPKDEAGGPYFNPEMTAEVNDKIAKVREEFASWAWRDAERKVHLENSYNDITRAIATPHFDGSFLEFPGMALRRGDEPFNLRQHQANAIWRGIVNQSGLYAHEVGSGKTYSIAGLAVESRRYGVARKPMILAHNANSAAVAAEFKEMYPGANVLYVDNLTGDQIQTTLRRIANEDWDAVVVPHSLVNRFTLSEKTLTSMMAEEIAALEETAIDAAAEDGVTLNVQSMDDEAAMKKVRSPTAKKLVNERNRIKNKIAEHAQRASKEGAIPFEELGVDMMIVDEVQSFKKIPVSTGMKVRGLNTDTSDRSLSLRFLTGYIKGLNNGRGIHLFTGTPITNSLVEIYNMQRYVMDHEMGVAGIKDWDAWFNTFADAGTDIELTASGDFEPVTRLNGFVNVADLRQMFGQYMDVVFADDMPEFKPREINGKTMASADMSAADRDFLLNGRTENPIGRPYKKVVNDVGPMSPEQQAVLAHQSRLYQEFKQASGKQRRDWMRTGDEHNPVIIEIASANAGLDVRLFDPAAGDHPQSKVNRVIPNILRHYHEHPESTQMVFVDRGHSDTSRRIVGRTQDGDKIYENVPRLNLVKDLIEKLVKGGIPRDEIAIINGSTPKPKRKQIADAMNEAKVRVTIGHRDAMGVGVNAQRNMRAMHHMDAPWTPGGLEQANGRGWRQGNKWNTVFEYRYVTDRLDGRRWQVLAIKDRFIKDFMHADENLRVIEGDAADIQEGDTAASDLTKTLSEAAGDPRILIRAKLTADISKLEKRERLHTYGQADAANKAKQLRSRIQHSENAVLPELRADVETFEKASADGKFEAVVGDKTYNKRDEANAAIAEIVKKLEKGQRNIPLVKMQGFHVDASWLEGFSEPSYMLRSEHRDIGVRPTAASIEGTLRHFPSELEQEQKANVEREASAKRLDAAAAEKFQQIPLLEEKKQQLRRLEDDLTANPVGAPPWLRQGAPIGTRIYVRDGDRLAPLDVTGHQWDETDYHVMADERAVPYLEALDENGSQIYEPHPFQAPPRKVEQTKVASAEDLARVTPAFDLTPRARENIDQIKGAIEKYIQDMVGGKVSINIVDAPDLGQSLQGWPNADERVTTGEYIKRSDVWNGAKLPLHGVINLALQGKTSPFSLASHEAVHALIDLAATDQEINVLKRERPRNSRMVQDYLGLDNEDMKHLAGFEVDAVAGEIYMNERNSGGIGTGSRLHIALRALFEKLWRVLRRIGNALRGLGFHTSEDIYRRMYEGEMRDRPLRTEHGIDTKSDIASVASTAMPGRSRVRKQAKSLVTQAEETGTDFVRASVDKMIDVLNLEREIEKATGTTLPETTRPYLAETLFHGRAGERMQDVWHNTIEPVIDDLKANGITRKEFSDYLYARHAPVRNAHIARINPGMVAGSGMSDQAAHAIVTAVNSGPKAAVYQRNAQRVYAMLKDALWARVSYGLMTQQEALHWQSLFGANYVPLRGFEEYDDPDGAGSIAGKPAGMSVRGRESQGALGRSSEASDILSQSMLQAADALIRGEKNRVAKALYDLARNHPDPALWTISNTETKRRLNPNTGRVETITVPVNKSADNVITVKLNGREQAIIIHKPQVAYALKNIGTDKAHWIEQKILRPLTRTFAKLRTAWDPQFILKNFQRDQADALLTIYTQYGSKGVAWYTQNLPHAVQGSFDVVMRGVHNTTWSALYDQYRLAGGKITWITHQHIENIVKDIQARMDEGKAKAALMYVPRMIEDLNEMMENATRMNLFATAKHFGATDMEAASTAREGTLNFDRSGAKTSLLSSLFPFFNANAQANLRFARLLRGATIGVRFSAKAARGAMAGMLMGGFLMALFNRYMMGDDKEKRSFWDNIPDWEKKSNIIIMSPAKDDRGRPVYIKLPMFAEGMLPWVAGSQAADVIAGKQSIMKAFSEVATAAINVIPILGSSHYGLPPIYDIPASLSMNEKWYGGPIHPDPSYFSHEAHQPKSQVKFPWTGEPWPTIAEWIGRVGGGDQFKRPASWLDMHPEDAQFLVEQVGGGLYSFLTGGASLLNRFAHGVAPSDVDIRDYPVLRQYWGHNYDTKISKDFAEERQKALDAKESVRRGDTRQETKDAARAAPIVESAAEQAKPLNKALQDVRKDQKLTMSEREKKLHELEIKRQELREKKLKQIEDLSPSKPTTAPPPASPAPPAPSTRPRSARELFRDSPVFGGI